jgi:aminopeptidase N
MIGSASGRAVKRIEDVRVLRQAQYPEDAGPMAHPIRPDSYVEINNFYTVTVYEKGAEVVRMYQSLFGQQGFRNGMDLYFSRHDGQAVTCDDFRAAMADANQCDLTQFERWYSQSGTPLITAEGSYDSSEKSYTLRLVQSCEPSKEQPIKLPFHIPFAIGLLDTSGKNIVLDLERPPKNRPLTEKNRGQTGTLILELKEQAETFKFLNVHSRPVPSMLRNFSAPVRLKFDYTNADLAFLMAHDTDPFNRWEASQRLVMQQLVRSASSSTSPSLTEDFSGRAVAAGDQELKSLAVNFHKVLEDHGLDPVFKETMVNLPSESMIAENMIQIDPVAIHLSSSHLKQYLAKELYAVWSKCYRENYMHGPYNTDVESVGKRALKNIALSYLAEIPTSEVHLIAEEQYQKADNMTDRLAALVALRKSDSPEACAALEKFYSDFETEALVIDKWFAFQAAAPDMTVKSIKVLMKHPAFSVKNPNRARSLIFTFCNANPASFHSQDGSGYAFWSEQVIMLDRINAQLAARLARSLDRWPKYASAYRDKMRAALVDVADARDLSNDVREVVVKALGA